MTLRGAVRRGASARTLTLLLSLTVALSGSAFANTIAVPAGGDLQAALDAVPAGGTILLQPGAVYTGSFVVPRAMTIRTNFPLPDARMTPAWAGKLAILYSPTNDPALRTAPGVDQLRLVGLEIAPNGSTSGTSIEIGSNLETDDSRQPRDVVLDRLLVRGHPTHGQKRGLSLHGRDIVVRRSHVSDFKLQGQDTQAIWINNGWGPYTIEDNYLEASGENIMAGGDTPRIHGLVPSDIRIVGNRIAKPLDWKTEPWTVKNLLEFKSARRVIVRGNVFEGSWVSGQVGYGILVTPKDQYGLAPWTTVQDVLIEQNIIREVSEAIRVLGDDHNHPATRAERITIRNNLIVADREAHGGAGRCLTVGRAPQRIEFSGNTCLANGPMAIYTYRAGEVQTIMGAVFRRNVFLHNQYGFSGDEATTGGLKALAAHYPNLVFRDNLIGGGDPSRYPGNHVVSVEVFKAQFVNYAAGDFRLTSASQAQFVTVDGGVLGADLTAAVLPVPWGGAGGPSPSPPVAKPKPSGQGTADVRSRTAVSRSNGPRRPAGAGGTRLDDSSRHAERRSGTPGAGDVRGVQTRKAGDDTGGSSAAVEVTRTRSFVAPRVSPGATPPSAYRTRSRLPAAASLPPTLSVTVSAPANALDAGSTVRLDAGAAYLPGVLVRVDFYVDDVFVGTADRAPFALQWQVAASGSHRIVAVGIDSSGSETMSAPLDVRVK